MKLEKREITLNEYDSLSDAYLFERNLLFSYTEKLENIKRKEIRAAILDCMRETAQDIFSLLDLREGASVMKGSADGVQEK